MADSDDPTQAARPGALRMPASTAVVGAPRATVPTTAATGSADGRYRVEVELARGGMGRVSRGVDVELGRAVAIKESLDRAPEVIARLLREAAITARLQHPSIGSLYDVARDDDGAPLLVMRLIDGRPLDQVIDATATLDERLALVPRVMAAVEAVAFAHRLGVIHRDLKPGNILVGDLGDTVVIDWGLASFGPDAAFARGGAPGVLADATLAGTVMGTPGFMAPEQARGEPADARADVFALGATLFYTLTGQRPFVGDSATRLIEQARAAPAQRIATVEPGVPRDLATVVDKALAHDPDARYPSAEALAADLRDFLAGRLVSAHHYSRRQRARRFARRQRVPLAIAAVAFAVVATVGGLAVRGVVHARDRAEAAAAQARAAERAAQIARDAESARGDELIEQKAREVLPTDPDRAVAFLRLRRARGDAVERAIVLEATAGGVGPIWDAHRGRITGAAWLGAGDTALTADVTGALVWHDLRGGRRALAIGAPVVLGPERLADGGAVVATSHELVRLGADGTVRARLALATEPNQLVTDGAWVAISSTAGVTVRDLEAARELVLPAGELCGLSASAGLVAVRLGDQVQATGLTDGATRALGAGWSCELRPDGAAVMIRTDDRLTEVEAASGRVLRTWPLPAGTYSTYGLDTVLVFAGGRLRTIDHDRPLAEIAGAWSRIDRHRNQIAMGVDRRVLVLSGSRTTWFTLDAQPTALAIGPDAARVLVGTAEGGVSVRSLSSGVAVHELGGMVNGVRATTHDSYLATLSNLDAVIVTPTGDHRLRDVLQLTDLRAMLSADATRVMLFIPLSQRVVLGDARGSAVVPGRFGGAALVDGGVLTVDERGVIAERASASAAASVIDELGEPAAGVFAAAAGTVVVVGEGGTLWRRRAGVIERARWAGTPTALWVAADGTAYLGVAGAVVAWPPGGAPSLRATVDGTPSSILAGAPMLVATTDRRIWVERAGALVLLATSQTQTSAGPLLDPRRVVAVGADGAVLSIDPRTAVVTPLPFPRGLIGDLAMLGDGTVLAVIDGRVHAWRDPSPTEPAALAAWTDGLTNATLTDVRSPLTWP